VIRRHRARFSFAIGLTLAIGFGAARNPAQAFTPESLWEAWPAARFVDVPAPCLDPPGLVGRLEALASRHPGALRLDGIGLSVQGRPILQMTLGRGERKVLLWSQMHGDEPSATPALLDLADFLLASDGEDPDATRILDELTLILIPMLNPDASEAYRRQNAQRIDVNRDALNLSTPEGRLLKSIRDRYEPVLGFNLHDQNRRRTAGPGGKPALNAILAVSGDEANTLTPERLLAKRAGAAVTAAIGVRYPGQMARYDEEFSPRAFGDNLTAWGTPILLIESGALVGDRPFEELARTNFVGILTALSGLAKNDLADHDPAVYDALPDNALGDLVDVAVRGGRILQPDAGPAYRADLAFDVERDDRAVAGCPADRGGRRGSRSEIQDLGDAQFLLATEDVDATGALLLPLYRVGVDGWKARKWLDGRSLERLASLGVAEVVWNLPRKRFFEGEDLADRANGEGRAHLVVRADGLSSGLLRLDNARWMMDLLDDLERHPGFGGSTTAGPAAAGDPSATASPASPFTEVSSREKDARQEDLEPALSLSELQAGLAEMSGDLALRSLDPEAFVRRLWRGGTDALAPDRDASFLLLSEGPDGGLDGSSRLLGVWLDGVAVAEAAP